MRVCLFIVLIAIVALQSSFSQVVPDKDIPFDLLFWKKELRLKKEQVLLIHEINLDLYNSVRDLSSGSEHIEPGNLQTLLRVWRAATAEVLTRKQKGNWQKILSRYSLDASNSHKRKKSAGKSFS